jgi:membrane protein
MKIRQTARNAWSILTATVNEWFEDQALRLAASLAFYTVLSLAPLILITIAIAGIFLGEEAARGHLSTEISGLIGVAGAEALESILQHAQSSSQGVPAALFGAVVLLFGASGVFIELQETMNSIWEVAPRPGRGWRGLLRDRFVSFSMVVGVGFLLLVSLVVSAVMTAMASRLNDALGNTAYVAQFFHIVISLGITTGIFALIFKMVPDVEIGWRDVWLGAAVTAVLFSVGKLLIGLYIGSTSVASTYGAAGSVVVILIWVYYSAQVLFFGAELTQVWTRRLGRPIRPRKNPVPMPRAVPGTVAPSVLATEPCEPLVPHPPGAPELRAAVEESLRDREPVVPPPRDGGTRPPMSRHS